MKTDNLITDVQMEAFQKLMEHTRYGLPKDSEIFAVEEHNTNVSGDGCYPTIEKLEVEDDKIIATMTINEEIQELLDAATKSHPTKLKSLYSLPDGGYENGKIYLIAPNTGIGKSM